MSQSKTDAKLASALTMLAALFKIELDTIREEFKSTLDPDGALYARLRALEDRIVRAEAIVDEALVEIKERTRE